MTRADDIAILPRPQQVALLGGRASRSCLGSVALTGDPGSRVAAHVRSFADRNGLQLRPATQASIKVGIDAAASPPLPESYALRVGDEVSLRAPDAPGLFYGLHTLQQLLDYCEEMPRCTVEDWPALRVRGAHFCMTRQVPTPDQLKVIIDRLAAVKINLLMIQYREFFPYGGFPLIVSSQSYTAEEIAEFVRYAADRHIQVVPLLQSLSFQEYILRSRAYAHLREQPEDVVGICPTHPDSFRLYSSLADQLIAAHPRTEYFHLGGDEANEVGQCERCRQARGERSNATLVTGFTNEVIRFLQDRGVKPMMWADMLFGHMEDPASVSDYAREMFAELSRDVVAVDWDYWSTGPLHPPAEHSPYPGLAGLSHVARLRDAGFEVVGAPSCSSCSNAARNSIDHELPFQNITAFADELKRRECLGMVTTFWPTDATPEVRKCRGGSPDETVDLCYRQVRPGMEAHWYSFWRGAECAWSSEPRAQAEYDRAFARTFLGTDDVSYPNALHLASSPGPGAASGEDMCARLTRASDLMGEAQENARKSQATVTYARLFLRLHHHELEWERFLGELSPMGGSGLSPEQLRGLRRLADERNALEREFRQAYVAIYKDVHLEEEVAHRFAEERRLQEQLLWDQERREMSAAEPGGQGPCG